MHELLVATTNADKLREIVRILEGLPVTLSTLALFPDIPLAEETGASFAENARQKAMHYAGISGMLTMAEDSGFEVEALNGEPGIHSARYLGGDATYEERFDDIYRRVRDMGVIETGASFVCALAAADATGILFETTGRVNGILAHTPAGLNGFGYDPIFLYPPYGMTFGEVSDERKTAVSHRGQAIRALRKFLEASRHSQI